MARAAAVALIVLVALAAGCRRRRAAAPRDAGGIACPSSESLANLVKEPGRVVRTDCVVYSPGFFWLAVALTTAEKPPLAPRLLLVSGGGTMSPIAFDIDPAPVAAIERLLGDLGVQIRKTRSSQHLVRVGVVGRRARGEWDEVGILLQLAAHAPPRLLWAGPGDGASLGSDGCITERRTEFEMPFRSDLQMFTSSRSFKPGGATDGCAPGGPGTQEGIAFRPLPLKAGRRLSRQ